MGHADIPANHDAGRGARTEPVITADVANQIALAAAAPVSRGRSARAFMVGDRVLTPVGAGVVEEVRESLVLNTMLALVRLDEQQEHQVQGWPFDAINVVAEEA